MKTCTLRTTRGRSSAVGFFTLLIAVPFLAASVFGQVASSPKPETEAKPAAAAAAPAGQPSEEEMMKMMMEMAKVNENHKLLGELEGTWDYTVKYWWDPSKPANESKGVAVRKAAMGGRYYTLDVTGKMQMPGPDGKMQDMDFKGMSIEGYDNVKKKFFTSWMDNMSTGMMMTYGTYDPATKTWTYTGTMEMMPGMETKVRETLKVTDKDHHLFEFFEDRDGKEVRTMEIAYVRKK